MTGISSPLRIKGNEACLFGPFMFIFVFALAICALYAGASGSSSNVYPFIIIVGPALDWSAEIAIAL